MSKYYTLTEWNPLTHKWEAEFGDHDREVVEDEKQDRLDEEHPPRMKVISSGETQAEINEELEKINN